MWIKNNPVAQGMVAAFVVVAIAWVYIKVRIARAIKVDRLKAVIKTQKAVDTYVEVVTKETAHEADEALEARDTAQPLNPDGMSDAQYERIFGRRRGPAQSG
jgi:hypothetical protein